jgi:hypothetical protein
VDSVQIRRVNKEESQRGKSPQAIASFLGRTPVVLCFVLFAASTSKASSKIFPLPHGLVILERAKDFDEA